MKPQLSEEMVVRIKPFDETIQVEEHKNGLVTTKNIDLDELVKCFQKSIKESKIIQSGFLPDHCLSYDISDRTKTLVIWVPAHYIDYTYFNTIYERFPLPNMVFSISIDTDRKTHEHRMAVAGEGPPKPAAPIYEFPFSNVYEDCGICIGGANSLPAYKNLRTLSSLPNFIISLPNNDHMFLRSRNKLNLEHRDLLEHLKNKDPSYYYTHVLIPRKRNRAAILQDFIQNKLGDNL